MLGLQNFIDLVGPVESAAWLNEVDQMRAFKAVKPAQTVRSSTITLTADPHLQFPAVPIGIWRATGLLQFQGSVTGTQGFVFGIQGPATGQQLGFYRGIVNNAATGDVLFNGVNPTGIFATIQTALTDFITFDFILVNNPVGAINLVWSQHASSANATLLNANSWMMLERFA